MIIKTFYIVPDIKIFNEELRIFDLFKTEHKITIDKIVGSECANWFKRAIRTGDFQ
mgnify:CR=1 FL=1